MASRRVAVSCRKCCSAAAKDVGGAAWPVAAGRDVVSAATGGGFGGGRTSGVVDSVSRAEAALPWAVDPSSLEVELNETLVDGDEKVAVSR
jgi:hypothetical protein